MVNRAVASRESRGAAVQTPPPPPPPHPSGPVEPHNIYGFVLFRLSYFDDSDLRLFATGSEVLNRVYMIAPVK